MESPPRLCACGCGAPVRVARFPSQQPRYIAGHQHRGAHNGNYRGGKVKGACAVCGAPFERFPSQTKVTCAAPACYAAWQALTTRASAWPRGAVTATGARTTVTGGAGGPGTSASRRASATVTAA
jgi:hypothetical protein